MENYEIYYYNARIEFAEARIKVLELERKLLKAEMRELPRIILAICSFVACAIYSVDFSGDVFVWKDNSLIVSLVLFGLFIFFLLRMEDGFRASSVRGELEDARKELRRADESYRNEHDRYIEIKRSLRSS